MIMLKAFSVLQSVAVVFHTRLNVPLMVRYVCLYSFIYSHKGATKHQLTLVNR